ncbi:MAG: dihydroneopterin aldolase [Prevotellaceae bacterium]|jgi:dihydroneopterin aldolase|nr:dihydroneopterin aldolase [Prevotellaceae bacterium]
MNTDSYISLNRLRLFARHGVYEEERTKGNDFIVDLHLKVDITRAMQTDDVADTVNYSEVCELVKREMAIPSNLLEHVAGRIARQLFRTFPTVESVDLRIAKCHPPMDAAVETAAVRIVMTRE